MKRDVQSDWESNMQSHTQSDCNRDDGNRLDFIALQGLIK